MKVKPVPELNFCIIGHVHGSDEESPESTQDLYITWVNKQVLGLCLSLRPILLGNSTFAANVDIRIGDMPPKTAS